MLPSMWRSELLHPMAVHFPIALLLVGTVLFVLSILFGQYSYFKNLRRYSFLILVIGTVGAWIGIITGNMAEDVVSPMLCDPEIRLNHEDYSYYAAYAFTAFVFFYLASNKISQKYMPFFLVLNVTLTICGSAMLVYTGHLGATLTYQQAAGVYNPGPECKGFE